MTTPTFDTPTLEDPTRAAVLELAGELATLVPPSETGITDPVFDETWTNSDRFNRWQRVTTFNWTTTATGSLYATSILNSIFGNTTTWSIELRQIMAQNHAYNWFSISFKTIMNTNQFAKGYLRFYIDYTQDPSSQAKARTCDGLDILAMTSTEGELVVPWNFNVPFITATYFVTPGTYRGPKIGFWVMDPLALPATAGTTITVSLMAKITGLRLAFPISPYDSDMYLAKPLVNEGSEASEVFYFPHTRRFIQPEQGAMMGNVLEATTATTVAAPTTTIQDFLDHEIMAEQRTLTLRATRVIELTPFPVLDEAVTPWHLMGIFSAYWVGSFKMRLLISKDNFVTGTFALVTAPEAITITGANYFNYPHALWNVKENYEKTVIIHPFMPTRVSATPPGTSAALMRTPTQIHFGIRVYLVTITPLVGAEGSVDPQLFVWNTPVNNRFFNMTQAYRPLVPTGAQDLDDEHLVNQSVESLGLAPIPITFSSNYEEILTIADFTTRATFLWDKDIEFGYQLQLRPSGYAVDDIIGRYPYYFPQYFQTFYAGWKSSFIVSLRSDVDYDVWRVIPVNRNRPTPVSVPPFGATAPTIYISGGNYAVLTVPNFCPWDFFYRSGMNIPRQHPISYVLAMDSYNVQDIQAKKKLTGYLQTGHDIEFFQWSGCQNNDILDNIDTSHIFAKSWTEIVPSLSFPGPSREAPTAVHSAPTDDEKPNSAPIPLPPPTKKTIGIATLTPYVKMMAGKMGTLENQSTRGSNTPRTHQRPHFTDDSDEDSDERGYRTARENAQRRLENIAGGDDDDDNPRLKITLGQRARKYFSGDIEEKINQKADHTMHLLEETSNSIRDTLQHTNSTIDTIGEFFADPGKALGKVVGDRKTVIWGVILELIDLCTSKITVTKITISGLKLANLIGMSPDRIYDMIKTIATAKRATRTQENNGDPALLVNQSRTIISNNNAPILGAVTLAVMVLGAYLTGSADMNPKKFTTYWEWMAQRGRDLMNIEAGIAASFKLFERVKELVAKGIETVFGLKLVTVDEDAMNKYEEQLQFCAQAVAYFEIPANWEKLSNSTKTREYAEKLAATHSDMYKFLATIPDLPVRLIKIHNLIARKINDVIVTIRENSIISNSKFVPFHIRIIGEPGIGKSEIVPILSSLLAKSQGLPEKSYSRTSGADFWDAHTGDTPILIRDDGDMVTDEDRGLELINLISPIPLILNKADLTKKGTTANFKLVISTGNSAFPTHDKINQQAWLRRTNMLIETDIKSHIDPQTNKRVEAPKIPRRFDHLNFKQLEPCDIQRKVVKKYNNVVDFLVDMIIEFSKHSITRMQIVNLTQELEWTPTLWTNDHRGLIREEINQYLRTHELAAEEVVPLIKTTCIVNQGKKADKIARKQQLDGPIPSTSTFDGIYRPYSTALNNETPEEDVVDVTISLEGEGDQERLVGYGFLPSDPEVTTRKITEQELIDAVRIALVRHNVWSGEEPHTPKQMLTFFARQFIKMRLPLPPPNVSLEMFRQIVDKTDGWKHQLFSTVLYETLLATFHREAEIRIWQRPDDAARAFIMKYRGCEPMFWNITRIGMEAGGYLLRAIVFPSPVNVGAFGVYCAEFAKVMRETWQGLTGFFKIISFGVIALISVAMLTGCWLKANAKETEKPKEIDGQLQAEAVGITIQDHYHNDLPDDGNPYTHAHICDKCGVIFHHAHKKNTYSYSIQFPHRCRNCRAKKLRVMRSVQEETPIIVPLDESESMMFPENAAYDHTVPKGRLRMKMKTENFAYDHTVPKGRIRNKIKVESTDAGIKEAIERVLDKQKPIESEYAIIDLEEEESDTEEKTTPIKSEEADSLIQPAPVPAQKLVNPINGKNEGKRTWTINKIPKCKNEAETDENNYHLRAKIVRNLGVMGTRSKLTNCYTHVNCFGIRERWVMTVYHTIKDRHPDLPIEFVFGGKEYSFLPRPGEIIAPETFWSESRKAYYHHDICFINLQRLNINCFSNMIGHFAKQEDLDKVNQMSGIYLTVLDTGDRHSISNMYGQKFLAAKNTIPSDSSTGALWSWRYDFPTRAGFCGGILTAHNPAISRKIVGFHFCGGEGFGCGVPVTQEMLMGGLGPHTHISAMDIEDVVKLQCDTELEHVDNPLSGAAEYLGVMKKGKALRIIRKTDLRTSPIYEQIAFPTTEPSVLSMMDPRKIRPEDDPLVKQLNKFSNHLPTPSSDVREYAVDMLSNFYLRKLNAMGEKHGFEQIRHRYRILSYEEAINGAFDVEPINFKTSAGYPYSLSGGKGKYKWFDIVGAYPDGTPKRVPNKQLQMDLDAIEDSLLKDGTPVNNFYVDTMKDERRPLEKIRECNTRLFNVGNLAWLIIKKRYWHWMYQFLKDLGTEGRTAIGMNMHGAEVTKLVEQLKQFECFSDLDVANWDGSYETDLMTDSGRVAQALMRRLMNWDNNTFEYGLSGLQHYHLSMILLTAEAMSSRIHICEDIMYYITMGMPSGDFLTALLNSLGHLLRDLHIWKMHWAAYKPATGEWFPNLPPELRAEITKRIETVNAAAARVEKYPNVPVPTPTPLNNPHIDWSKIHKFFDYVYNCVMGDDKVDSTSEAIAPFFTPEHRQYWWKQLGYKVTDARKTGIMKWTEFEDLEFLKCRFRQHERFPALYTMAIDKNRVIHELTNWIRVGQDPIEAIKTNIDDALRFIYAHGEEEYNTLSRQITSALRDRQIEHDMIPYESMDREWMNSHNM